MTRYIQRTSAFKRVIHGIVALSSLGLIATGAVLFVPAIAAAVGIDVLQVLRVVHRVFAVSFIIAPLVGLIAAPQGFVHMMKNIFARWDKDDKRFMVLFPKYLFSPKKTHMPKQHEVKSGQRLADGMLLAAGILLAATGVVLWLGTTTAPLDLFRVALMLHGVAFIIFTVVLLAHAYLGSGLFQPYRGIARVMWGDGKVSEADARYHWGYWAEDELASGKNVVEE